MRTEWPAFKARVSNRLARHFHAAPLRWPDHRPMVSFTFDDAPDSAASAGAALLEDHGGRATFYIAGGLVDKPSDHWQGVAAEDIVALHRKGHEIACHTFSHRRAFDLDAAEMAAEIEQNRRYLEALDPSIRVENFAYPYGLAAISHKSRMTEAFRSARGILPGINHGMVDLQFLRAVPLVNVHIDAKGVDARFDEAEATGGWLIFYGHDVTARPSPFGCTPQLLRGALKAAARRKVAVVTVAEALRQAGA